MDFSWGPFPLLRFTLAFVAGVLAFIYLPFIYVDYGLFYGLVLLYLLIFFLQNKIERYFFKPLLGVIALSVLFCFGYILTEHNTEKLNHKHIANLSAKTKITAFTGRVVDAVQSKEKSFKTLVNIERIKVGEKWMRAEGKILTYFEKDSLASINYGSNVMVRTFVKAIEGTKNPAEFDYRQYLAFHNIHHQAYAKAEHYLIEKNESFSWFDSPNILIFYAQKSSKFLEEKLTMFIKEKREYGIANALILGIKKDLDGDLTKAYSGVGAMHVLAVSGLHVGLVYKIFLMLLGWISKRGWVVGKIFQGVLLLVAIWIYAFVTGLSPSVLRAATMFSFIIIASAANRQTNIYNTLSASMFFLLCWNPYMIMEVGFQLSYLAVIGIVYFQPRIYRLMDVNNTLLDLAWQITCVSIAAQISTFPLSMLYFHQFPTYFFISNLVVIPAAIFILNAGILLLILSPLEALADILGKALEFVIWLTNEIIIYLNQIPFALISGIDISIFETWLIYFAIFLLALFFYYKNLKIYLALAIVIIVISVLQFEEFYKESQKKEIVFYQVKNHLAIGLRNGYHITFISDKNLSANDSKMLFHIWHHWWRENINKIDYVNFENIENEFPNAKKVGENILLTWDGKSILIYRKTDKQSWQEPLGIDFLVLHENPWIDKQKLKTNYTAEAIVADGSNNYKTLHFANNAFKDYDFYSGGAVVFH